VYPIRPSARAPFFLRHADSCGWATWGEAWELFEPDGGLLLAELDRRKLTDSFDMGHGGFTEMLRMQTRGEIDSWAVRWYASVFLRERMCLFPGASLVQNIGFDGTGMHSGRSAHFRVATGDRPVVLERQTIEEDPGIRRGYERFFTRSTRRARLKASVPFADRIARAVRGEGPSDSEESAGESRDG